MWLAVTQWGTGCWQSAARHAEVAGMGGWELGLRICRCKGGLVGYSSTAPSMPTKAADSKQTAAGWLPRVEERGAAAGARAW